MYTLKVLSNTVFKRSSNQSAILPPNELRSVEAGQEFPIHSCSREVDHLHFALGKDAKGNQVHFNGFTNWFAYLPHVQLIEQVQRSPEVKPVISFNPEFKPKDMGTSFNVPGVAQTLYSGQAIGRSKNFLWYEATHNLTRLPKTTVETAAIIRMAEAAQVARDKIGKPFFITSWFRPEPFNSRVGGARQSRHLAGDAIDFYIEGWSPAKMYDYFDSWWLGGVGKYAHNDILHLDARGYNSRWFY